MSEDAILVAECVSKRFGTRRVLSGGYLHARRGRISGLLGRNGSGKTTLLEIAVGLRSADAATVRYDNEVIVSPRLHIMAQRGVFYWPADRSLLSPAVTIAQQLRAVRQQAGAGEVDQIVSALALDRLLRTHARNLSAGERKRCHLAFVLIRQPRCLVADEPFRGLSPLDAELVLGSLKRLAQDGAAIVITGHEMGFVRQAVDDVLWLVDGATRVLGDAMNAADNELFRRGYLGA